ncbi:peptidase inhibitor family I36 protein [Streptomyces sp. NPDC015171]|uniref:peptidase inhibitor family I36 protein n=1 Tax=Streptomyces sp. NPDC015171 TaxID=3364945 RepID=UPI0036F53FF3
MASAPNAGAAEARCYFFCVWEHDDFGGKHWGINVLQEPHVGECRNISADLNNKASSMSNPSTARVLFYDAKNCSGSSGYAAHSDSSDKDLTNNHFDNKTSSVKFVRP